MTMGRGSDDNNNYANGQTLVSYCFRSIPGYSIIGSYQANGGSNGVFVFTGFKPAFLIVKRTNSSDNWFMLDTARNINNPVNSYIMPNLSSAEDSNNSTVNIDFLSNGFKVRGSSSAINTDGSQYLYLAFASSPFVTSDGVPTTAR